MGMVEPGRGGVRAEHVLGGSGSDEMAVEVELAEVGVGRVSRRAVAEEDVPLAEKVPRGSGRRRGRARRRGGRSAETATARRESNARHRREGSPSPNARTRERAGPTNRARTGTTEERPS